MKKINKILFITLSNIGDAILTLPAMERLMASFPDASVSVVASPRSKEIFRDNPLIEKVFVYDKRAPFREKLRLVSTLNKNNFDLVADMRRSLLGFVIKAKYKNSFFEQISSGIKHMRQRHLYKLKDLIKDSLQKEEFVSQEKVFYISPKAEESARQLLLKRDILTTDRIIVISAGARSSAKRWPPDKFIELILKLSKQYDSKFVLVGDEDDAQICAYIAKNCAFSVTDLSAKTSISELACILKRAQVVIANDSAVLHLASYLDVSVVAIFGPTDDSKYGPWSRNSVVIKKEISCRPCQTALCKMNNPECLLFIKPFDVIRAVNDILGDNPQLTTGFVGFKRILIVRTDRIGDVLLSTPVISALRVRFPNAYIAMMIDPRAKDVIDGNPYLDEIIIYDKYVKHKGFISSFKFSSYLKSKNFDLALILHPTDRVNLIAFFAGIKKRVGYNRKFGFLLTDKLSHTKQLGEKHESEYCFDLLEYIGIFVQEKKLYMPIREDSEKWVDELFVSENIGSMDKLLGIHPAASCPSKIWPVERFAQVAERLSCLYGFKILVLSGPKDIKLADELIRGMKGNAVNLAGKISISQVASVLKRCRLFISNDSGPVHIATAVGTPVISIFGRNQKGLSPRRWGPLGSRDCVLHKEVGCIECLAHGCRKEFACLKAITVDEVLNVAREMVEEGDALSVKP